MKKTEADCEPEHKPSLHGVGASCLNRVRPDVYPGEPGRTRVIQRETFLSFR